MPRNHEKNAEVRESRKRQILNAALSVYVRFGYHGTDMDAVAEEAGLAKGLLYYYYKTKKELFVELYSWMFNEAYFLSDTLLENTKDKNPIERLMYYTYGMFCANKENPHLMQFSIRAPFDAYVIFGSEQRAECAKKSDMHRDTLASIIEQGICEGFIPNVNPSNAANSFWSVFVANVFTYSKLMLGTQSENEAADFIDLVRFCFQGLGVEHDIWNSCLEKIVSENQGRTNP